MTQDEIIEMARQAGSEAAKYPSLIPKSEWETLERFAKLVAAAAASKERERIAQMIEGAPPLVDFARNEHGGCLMCGFTPKQAASAIRARGVKHDN